MNVIIVFNMVVIELLFFGSMYMAYLVHSRELKNKAVVDCNMSFPLQGKLIYKTMGGEEFVVDNKTLICVGNRVFEVYGGNMYIDESDDEYIYEDCSSGSSGSELSELSENDRDEIYSPYDTDYNSSDDSGSHSSDDFYYNVDDEDNLSVVSVEHSISSQDTIRS